MLLGERFGHEYGRIVRGQARRCSLARADNRDYPAKIFIESPCKKKYCQPHRRKKLQGQSASPSPRPSRKGGGGDIKLGKHSTVTDQDAQ